jgi:hypothetical protein
VTVELQGQRLAQERELDSQEGIIAVWKEGLVTFERALGMVLTERDAGCVRADAVQQDFFTHACVSSSMSK